MRRGRIAGAIALCALCALLGFAPGIKGTFALLTARTGNPNSLFAATALYAPGSLQATPSGRNGALTWTAGQNGNGYRVLGLGNGTSSACPASTSAFLPAANHALRSPKPSSAQILPLLCRERPTRPLTSFMFISITEKLSSLNK